MAGRARLKALREELDRRVANLYEGDDPLPSHLDYICDRVESGTLTKAIAAELQESLDFDFSYGQLMTYLRNTFGEDTAHERIDSARARASHCLAEEALEIVDAKAESSVDVQRASARAKQRNWLAERYNPDRFGQRNTTNVSISLGQMHLAALKARPKRVTGGSAITPTLENAQGQQCVQVVEAPKLIGA